jgi:hypothetical protein
MRDSVVLGFVAACSVAACLPPAPSGLPPDPGGGSGSNAEPEFLSNVAPLFDQDSCTGCHTGLETDGTYHFLGQSAGDPQGYYTALLTQPLVYGGGDGNFNPNTALLVTKGPHEGNNFWTPTQLATVEQWLGDEANRRAELLPPNPGGGSTPVPGGQSAETAMEQWAACLTTAAAGSAYYSTGVYLLSQMQSERGRCESCHDPGEPGGEALFDDPAKQLTAWETSIGVLTEVSLQDTGSGYLMIPADQKFADKSMEENNGNGTHPTFTYSQPVNNIDMTTALHNFVNAVNGMLLAGQCPAPGYVSGS